MSSLQYFNYERAGRLRSGQTLKRRVDIFRELNRPRALTDRRRSTGGWDSETNVIYKDIDAQIDQAFKNIFRVNSYRLPLDDVASGVMRRNFEQWLPSHKPVWTCIGVAQLSDRVEIEVQAYDPKQYASDQKEQRWMTFSPLCDVR
ncbi:hypothetical protein BD413DRAFT_614939 [Trametes elegans]|nr:hypothetical protein BD413DRAFT_614939 [Trametes elegans]